MAESNSGKVTKADVTYENVLNAIQGIYPEEATKLTRKLSAATLRTMFQILAFFTVSREKCGSSGGQILRNRQKFHKLVIPNPLVAITEETRRRPRLLRGEQTLLFIFFYNFTLSKSSTIGLALNLMEYQSNRIRISQGTAFRE